MQMKNTMENKVKYLIWTIIFFACSCNREYTPVEYKQWVESSENGLFKSKRMGVLTYETKYITPEYQLILSNGPRDIEDLNIKEELANTSEGYNFQFTIRNQQNIPPLRYQLHDEEEYFGRIQYFNNAASKDFFLIKNNTDTLPCVFAHMERDFGISPELRLQLSFGEVGKHQDIQLCYQDKVFNNGMLKFQFKENDLTHLPELIQY